MCRPPPLFRQLDYSTTRSTSTSLLSFLSPASVLSHPSLSKLSSAMKVQPSCPPTPPVLTPSIVWKDHPISASPRMGRILSQLQSPFPLSSPSPPSLQTIMLTARLGPQKDNQLVRSRPSCVRCIPPLSRAPSRSAPSSNHRHQYNLTTPKFPPSP